MADNEIDAALNMGRRMDKAGMSHKQQERTLRSLAWDEEKKLPMRIKGYKNLAHKQSAKGKE